MKPLSQYGREYRSEARALGLGDRLCDWMVFSLASWTLVCHTVVGFGGGVQTLVLWGLGLLGLAAAARFVPWRGTSEPSDVHASAV